MLYNLRSKITEEGASVNRIHDSIATQGENEPAKSPPEFSELVRQLETDEQRRTRHKSHLIIYITSFTMSIGFSMVLTPIWPYLKQVKCLFVN